MHREPVLEAVHAARVFGHIAADGAGDLAAGVGRIVQTVGGSGFADGEVAHAALHQGRAAVGIDVEDFVELGQRQRHAHGVRHGAARKARARATCNDGRSYGMAGLEHSLHLSISLWQADQQRALSVGRQSVALIGRGVFALIEQGMRRHMGAQCLHHLGLAPSTLGRLGRVMRGVGCSAGGSDEIGKSAGERHACKCRGCARALV